MKITIVRNSFFQPPYDFLFKLFVDCFVIAIHQGEGWEERLGHFVTKVHDLAQDIIQFAPLTAR